MEFVRDTNKDNEVLISLLEKSIENEQFLLKNYHSGYSSIFKVAKDGFNRFSRKVEHKPTNYNHNIHGTFGERHKLNDVNERFEEQFELIISFADAPKLKLIFEPVVIEEKVSVKNYKTLWIHGIFTGEWKIEVKTTELRYDKSFTLTHGAVKTQIPYEKGVEYIKRLQNNINGIAHREDLKKAEHRLKNNNNNLIV